MDKIQARVAGRLDASESHPGRPIAIALGTPSGSLPCPRSTPRLLLGFLQNANECVGEWWLNDQTTHSPGVPGSTSQLLAGLSAADLASCKGYAMQCRRCFAAVRLSSLIRVVRASHLGAFAASGNAAGGTLAVSRRKNWSCDISMGESGGWSICQQTPLRGPIRSILFGGVGNEADNETIGRATLTSAVCKQE